MHPLEEAAFLKLCGKLKAFLFVIDMETFSLILSRLFFRAAVDARDPVEKALTASAFDTREFEACERVGLTPMDRYFESSLMLLAGRFCRQNSRRRLILGEVGSSTAQSRRQAMKSSVSMSGTRSSSSSASAFVSFSFTFFWLLSWVERNELGIKERQWC